MMNTEIISKRLEYIKEKLADLSYDLENYEITSSQRDRKTIEGAIDSWCEEIVDSAVTINNELLREQDKESKTYYTSFTQLEALELFEKEFLEKLAATAGFRNRLVHDYMNVDTQISIESAKNIVKLYHSYIEVISSYMEKISLSSSE